mmetsp:Transcript_7454/g.23440  ORF Transcript_7454/g.23440 Transcript_7454/m.23440 type:complete len:231 (+) Transcript_7454:340-1032(+)
MRRAAACRGRPASQRCRRGRHPSWPVPPAASPQWRRMLRRAGPRRPRYHSPLSHGRRRTPLYWARLGRPSSVTSTSRVAEATCGSGTAASSPAEAIVARARATLQREAAWPCIAPSSHWCRSRAANALLVGRSGWASTAWPRSAVPLLCLADGRVSSSISEPGSSAQRWPAPSNNEANVKHRHRTFCHSKMHMLLSLRFQFSPHMFPVGIDGKTAVRSRLLPSVHSPFFR